MNRRQLLTGGAAAVGALSAVGSATADSQAARLTFDGGRLSIGGDTATVTGQTRFAAGTQLRVRLRSAGSSPFIRSSEATVEQGGSFMATVDLSSVPIGTTFTASVFWYQFVLAEEPGRVVHPDPSVQLDYEGERLTVKPAADQQITGTSALPAGEPLVIRVRNSGTNPFLSSTNTETTATGTFATIVDFADIEPGTTFKITVRYGGRVVATADGIVQQ
ncbi:BGTF surface domain-containing protein [Halosegnis sp.]|uniref:BGTF surface domain-containing protein n=1 Tax=Halosegnis sp. TaxID=2864959 RepID=UPI0035D3E541